MEGQVRNRGGCAKPIKIQFASVSSMTVVILQEPTSNECVDIDECSESPAICHAGSACENIDGSYTCRCDPGYHSDGSTCVDINECIQNVCPDALKYCTNFEVS